MKNISIYSIAATITLWSFGSFASITMAHEAEPEIQKFCQAYAPYATIKNVYDLCQGEQRDWPLSDVLGGIVADLSNARKIMYHIDYIDNNDIYITPEVKLRRWESDTFVSFVDLALEIAQHHDGTYFKQELEKLK